MLKLATSSGAKVDTCMGWSWSRSLSRLFNRIFSRRGVLHFRVCLLKHQRKKLTLTLLFFLYSFLRLKPCIALLKTTLFRTQWWYSVVENMKWQKHKMMKQCVKAKCQQFYNCLDDSCLLHVNVHWFTMKIICSTLILSGGAVKFRADR